jgi:hypothetical protein
MSETAVLEAWQKAGGRRYARIELEKYSWQWAIMLVDYDMECRLEIFLYDGESYGPPQRRNYYIGQVSIDEGIRFALARWDELLRDEEQSKS